VADLRASLAAPSIVVQIPRVIAAEKQLRLERLHRLYSILVRIPGHAVSVRDLCRTYGMKRWELSQAEATGWIEFQKRKPPTGRPSLLCQIRKKVNTNAPAKLPPLRGRRNRSLSLREREFLNLYLCPYGVSILVGNGHSAAWAYRKVYGRHRDLTEASIRSAGARLARRPWMWAARILSCRLHFFAAYWDWPCDMRSHGRGWCRLVSILDSEFLDWPFDIALEVSRSRTVTEAAGFLKDHPLLSFRREDFIRLVGG
jgi:hypothetical protein